MEEWIAVGTVYRKHGVRGEVKVYPLTDSPSRFRDLGEVWIRDRAGRRHRVRIDGVRFQGDRVLLHFAGRDTPEAVEPYLQGTILIPRSEAVPLPPGRYYHADIIGLTVFTEEETCLGKVEEILETGSNDVYVVRGAGREILVPALREVIREVDVQQGRLVIRPMEGLLE